jgi:hypothetical protein
MRETFNCAYQIFTNINLTKVTGRRNNERKNGSATRSVTHGILGESDTLPAGLAGR